KQWLVDRQHVTAITVIAQWHSHRQLLQHLPHEPKKDERRMRWSNSADASCMAGDATRSRGTFLRVYSFSLLGSRSLSAVFKPV
uniref:Uncharacterized protein n=1 Tax=Parascaris univalens TaxID=6257 RepID=A0A915CF48_PARUN